MPKPAKNTICLWYDRDAEEEYREPAKPHQRVEQQPLPGEILVHHFLFAFPCEPLARRSPRRSRRRAFAAAAALR